MVWKHGAQVSEAVLLAQRAAQSAARLEDQHLRPSPVRSEAHPFTELLQCMKHVLQPPLIWGLYGKVFCT